MTPSALAVSVPTLNKFFLVLTLLANAVVITFVVLALVGAMSERAHDAVGGVVDVIGPNAIWLAFAVAATTTAGSLYYSEVAHFTPCVLCWYQRICLYPLTAILFVGAMRRDPGVRMYVLPFLVIGPMISGYHFLVERSPSLGEGLSCSLEAPCAVPWFTELGFVTLAYMCLSAFLLIAGLVVVDSAADRRAATRDHEEAPVAPRIPEVSAP